ncbi:hypothetical protein PS664_05732 [Pseudomonas fluorescens]|nr:hypothetical protein PS664_05732 [Pseudomonas fluorescens]
MSYLKTEINEALNDLCIQHKELNPEELNALIVSLCRYFFREGENILDPTRLIAKETEYNPGFWQEISKRIQCNHLLLVVFDTAYRAWEIGDSRQLQQVLSETTGYPFWVTDINLSLLVFMDDHSCVSWA